MFEDLAGKILNLDPNIINCHILTESDGSVQTDLLRSEFKGQVKGYSKAAAGMGPAWGLAVINILRRLDTERSKLHYVLVAREQFDALFFPVLVEEKELVIGILLRKEGEPSKIYKRVMQII